MGIHREIVSLEDQLREGEGWEGRVRVLEGLLGVGGVQDAPRDEQT